MVFHRERGNLKAFGTERKFFTLFGLIVKRYGPGRTVSEVSNQDIDFLWGIGFVFGVRMALSPG